MPRTLRSRLTLIYLALIVTILALLGVYLVFAARALYVDRLAGQLAAQARLAGEAVGPTLQAGGGIDQVDPLVKRLGGPLAARLTIIAPDGTVLGDSIADPRTMENHANRPEVRAAVASGDGTNQRESATLHENFLYVAVPIPADPGAVARVALPLTEVDSAVHRIQRDLIIATGLAALLAVAVTVAVSGWITRPLERLRQRVNAVAAGDLDTAVAPVPTREIGELGAAFNAMTARLRSLVAELEQSRLRLEATLANLSDGVVITDAAGAVLLLNRAAGEMFDVAGEEATGRDFMLVARDHDLAAVLREALATGERREATVDYGPRRLVLDVSAQRLRGGREQLGVLVLRDVTELRRLERLRRDFVANVSHELRTPLTSVKALVETLAAGAIDDPAVADDFLGRVVAEVDHLAALVDELLDLARLESGRAVLHTETRDPAEAVRRAVERLRPQAERADLTLRTDLPGALPPVAADWTRIDQVMLNLVHNAIKFTAAGGEIVVSAAEQDSFLAITVRDNGAGIARDELPRLFERFYKVDKARHSAGTGLGLAIAKHIVQAHGGAITAASELGRGTTITFTLPLTRQPAESAMLRAGTADSPQRRSRIDRT
jgi:two-component system phosphate regulon sensor histidine kinase PhoR